MRIYTKGGDKGTTGIFGGSRVDKDDIRIETNGTLDELNATLGVIRALLDEKDERQEILAYIQRTLMIVMSQVATPSNIREQNQNILPEDIDRYCERRLCTLNKTDEIPPLILRFVNRLSDLLFTMARWEMDQQGAEEERWKAFLYKKKKQ